jgi:hypothetical protein
MTREEEILDEMIPLSSPDKLPQSLFENCKNIWKAFNLGQEYIRKTECDRLEATEKRIRELEEAIEAANTALYYTIPEREINDTDWDKWHKAKCRFYELYSHLKEQP